MTSRGRPMSTCTHMCACTHNMNMSPPKQRAAFPKSIFSLKNKRPFSVGGQHDKDTFFNLRSSGHWLVQGLPNHEGQVGLVSPVSSDLDTAACALGPTSGDWLRVSLTRAASMPSPGQVHWPAQGLAHSRCTANSEWLSA